MIIESRRRLMVAAGRLAVLAVMGLLAVADFSIGFAEGLSGATLVVAPAMILLMAAVAIAASTPYPGNPQRLPVHTILVAAGSLGVTYVTLLAVGQEGFARTFGLAEAAGMLVLIFRVARHAVPDLSVAAVIVGSLAVAVQPIRVGYPDVPAVVGGLVLAICAFGAAAAGTYLRMLAAGRERQILAVRAEERVELARDLHDFVAHHITGIVVQAQGARMIAGQDQRVVTALEQIENAGAQAMTSMRRMVGLLRSSDSARDAPVTPVATVADIGPLVSDFGKAGGTIAELHTQDRLDGLPVEVMMVAHRVIMESLTNVRRHASAASRVDVSLDRTPEWLLVRVVNDGPAPRSSTVRERDGFGLVGLAERVAAIGGRFKAGPGINVGWDVEAALPLGREDAT